MQLHSTVLSLTGFCSLAFPRNARAETPVEAAEAANIPKYWKEVGDGWKFQPDPDNFPDWDQIKEVREPQIEAMMPNPNPDVLNSPTINVPTMVWRPLHDDTLTPAQNADANLISLNKFKQEFLNMLEEEGVKLYRDELVMLSYYDSDPVYYTGWVDYANYVFIGDHLTWYDEAAEMIMITRRFRTQTHDMDHPDVKDAIKFAKENVPEDYTLYPELHIPQPIDELSEQLVEDDIIPLNHDDGNLILSDTEDAKQQVESLVPSNEQPEDPFADKPPLTEPTVPATNVEVHGAPDIPADTPAATDPLPPMLEAPTADVTNVAGGPPDLGGKPAIEPPSPTDWGLIAGLLIGGFVLLLTIGCFFVWKCMKQRRTRETQQEPSFDGSADSAPYKGRDHSTSIGIGRRRLPATEDALLLPSPERLESLLTPRIIALSCITQVAWIALGYFLFKRYKQYRVEAKKVNKGAIPLYD